MDYEYINFTTLEVFKKCDVHSYPIDCHDILKQYDIDVYPYSSLNDELHEYCVKYSNDALNYRGKICYNDKLPIGRIRFSLMHELGHIVLNHCDNHTPEIEQEANYFASNILAPRMVIHYAGCKNQADVSKLFGLTNEAAQYAFDDYRRWHRQTIYYKMTDFDKVLYSHFYNEKKNRFVYHINRCVYCGDEIFNSNDYICKNCDSMNQPFNTYRDFDTDLLIAESQWLYGGL